MFNIYFRIISLTVLRLCIFSITLIFLLFSVFEASALSSEVSPINIADANCGQANSVVLQKPWQKLSKLVMHNPSPENLNAAITYSAHHGSVSNLIKLLDYVIIYHDIPEHILLAHVAQLDLLGEHEKAVKFLNYLLKKVPQRDKENIANLLKKMQSKARHDKKLRVIMIKARSLYASKHLSASLAVLNHIKAQVPATQLEYWQLYYRVCGALHAQQSTHNADSLIKIKPVANKHLLTKSKFIPKVSSSNASKEIPLLQAANPSHKN